MRFLVSVIFIAFAGLGAAQTSALLALADQVDLDSLLFTVEELSGMREVRIDGATAVIQSRHKDWLGNEVAERRLALRLREYGYEPVVDSFSQTGANVLAELRGTTYPNRQVIICAHYDSQPNQAVAPGADDNASGCAAVMEAARLFKDREFPLTVLFAFWDEEEQGLVGSRDYADRANERGDSIVAVYNIDMIGWDENDDGEIEIHSRARANTRELVDLAAGMIDGLGLDLTPVAIDPGTTASDHAPFWNKSRAGMLFIERYYGNDFNDNYHKPSDTLGNFNIPYFHAAARWIVAAAAAEAWGFRFNPRHEPPIVAAPGETAELTLALDETLSPGEPPTLFSRRLGDATVTETVGSPLDSGRWSFLLPAGAEAGVVEYYFEARDSLGLISQLSPPNSLADSLEDFHRLYVGASLVFEDPLDDLDDWTIEGAWGLTDALSVSASNSLTDSPGGDYANDVSSWAELRSFDLANYAAAALVFQTRYETEEDWDYFRVVASSDGGANWESLPGRLSESGVGSGQPGDEPLYDGTEPEWRTEVLDLDGYLGGDVLVRFVFRSDGSNVADGAYIDDVRLYAVSAPADAGTAEAPKRFYLYPNYPNPFNPETTVRYELPDRAVVSLELFNALGEKVATLDEGAREAGTHSVAVNAGSLPSGAYFYRLRAGERSDARKMIILK
jgi:hypothetical protein